MRMSGATDGTIIATIMTDHMTKSNQISTRSHGSMWGMPMSIDMSMPVISLANLNM